MSSSQVPWLGCDPLNDLEIGTYSWAPPEDDDIEACRIPKSSKLPDIYDYLVVLHPGYIKLVPEELRSRAMCNYVFKMDPYLLIHIPEKMRTPKMKIFAANTTTPWLFNYEQ